ncbi:MAG: dTDP-glucose 4,6-dehydratase [Candidatus Calescibacterium sp.]|nr:dTDP-glucose 4,6-dehydratase [Candidatus Calescibacterium sp.]
MKTILITGGAGFIGSNFVKFFLEKHSEYMIINLDLLTYAGNLENIKDILEHKRHKFIKGDICNRELLEYIFEEYDVRGVIHFAAESHVDNSIKTPERFFYTNVLGTFTLIDVAYRYWMKAPFEYRDGYENCLFHHISTDEVFGALGETGYFTEESPYRPNSPYSASKASSDLIVRSYNKTYGLNTVITNSSNNFGKYQHDEKFIPTIIRHAIYGKPIPIYGDGKNVRDWLYVLDHCEAIDLVFHKGRIGEIYLIGARNEMSNINLATLICEILDQIVPRKDGNSYKSLISSVKDRPGHDFRYGIDPKKIENELNWKPKHNFLEALHETVLWYVNKYSNRKCYE